MQDSTKKVKDLKNYRTVRSIKSLKLKKQTRLNRFHIIFDLYKCNDKALGKASLLEQKVKKIFNHFNLETRIQTFYQFQPFGVTAIVCANGLQFTIHTWPEYNSAAIDIYCFNSRETATQVCDHLRKAFKCNEYEMKVRKR